MIVKDGGWYVTCGAFNVGPLKRCDDGLFRKEGSEGAWREDGYAVDDKNGMFRLHHSFNADDPAMWRPIRPGEPAPKWEQE